MQQMVHYTIQVLDENDNSPTFQAGSYYNTTVQEDHAVRMPLLATDSTWGLPRAQIVVERHVAAVYIMIVIVGLVLCQSSSGQRKIGTV